jgi:hypothetical protein
MPATLYPTASPSIKKSFEGIWMYEISGGFINKYFNYADPTISRDRVVQLYPPASPSIEKSFEGIWMYEISGGFIKKYFNYAGPTIRNACM